MSAGDICSEEVVQLELLRPGNGNVTAPLPSGSDLDRFGELHVSRDDSRRRVAATADITSRENRAQLIAALEELSIAEGELRSQHQALEEAHRQLELQRERYHTLFQLAPDPYLVTDQKGIIEEANAAAGDLLGVPSTLLVRKPLLAYLNGEARAELEQQLDRLASSGRVDKWALAIEARDGSLVPMEATASLWVPLRDLRDLTRHTLRPVPGQPPEILFPSIELNGIPLWGFTYRLIADWLSLGTD